jgi:hypothetical protein
MSPATFDHSFAEGAAMNEAAIVKKLYELTDELAVPLKPTTHAAKTEGVYISHSTKPGRAPSPEDMLEDLALRIKYLLFDLEATRRENRFLRQMLDSRPRPGQDAGGPEGPVGQ